MIPERLLYLGPDLAAAHFLVHRGASVKFVGDDAWYKRDGKGVRGRASVSVFNTASIPFPLELQLTREQSSWSLRRGY